MAEDQIKAVLHYTQALKAPRIRESAARLAEQARDANWTHEEYLAAVLSREVAAREASGAATRTFAHHPGTLPRQLRVCAGFRHARRLQVLCF
jgi:DNA replication protein DnaC